MQTLFEVKATLEPQKDQVWVIVKQPATLQYKVENVTVPPPQETRFGNTSPSTETAPSEPFTVGYEVCVDKKVWSLEESSEGQGVIDVQPQEFKMITLNIIPNVSGPLPVPTLQLTWPARGQGSCMLTSAQVYNVNHGQVVTVHTSTAQGEQN